MAARLKCHWAIASVALLVGSCLGATATARAADDPVVMLDTTLNNLINAPKLTSTLRIAGASVRAKLVVNVPERFLYQDIHDGRDRTRTLWTSRVTFERSGKRRCWKKRRNGYDFTERPLSWMKTGISEVEQTAPDTISYTQAEGGTYRIAMRYDPVTLLPAEFNATHTGTNEPDAFDGYTMTYVYRATDRLPRHKPICHK